MALSKDQLTQLKNEVKMAKALNTEQLEPILSENLQRYVGTFTPAFGQDWDVVLNEIYPIIQTNLPSIFFRNPRAFLKPRNKTFIIRKRNPISGKMEEVEADSGKSAKTQEDILNYCLSEINYKNEVRKVLMDALLFPYGVLWHGYKGDFGMTEEQSLYIKKDRVFVKRVSPTRFIKDPNVNMSNLDEARWVGRVIDIPLLDLVEDDRLDVDKNIKGYKGYGEKIGSAPNATGSNATPVGRNAADYIRINAARRSMIEYAEKDFQNSKLAKFVQVEEIFIRPTKKEAREGKSGTIVLITAEQEKPLRQSEWTIKAEGFPAHILQFNELNDSFFGLSDPETYKQIADQKNAIVNLQLRNAQENCKVWVALAKGGAQEEDIEHIQRGDNTIIAFEGESVQGKMAVMSPGGQASNELYLIDQRIQRNLEDKSGVSDLKRGFLQSGEESATSVQIRNAGSNARPSYRQDMMSDFLKKSFTFTNALLKQFVPYKDAVRIVGSLDLQWSEKPEKEELQAPTDVEIDAISMLPENPEKELQEFNAILTLMFQGIKDPAIQQKILQEGYTFNINPIIQQILYRLRIKDPDVFRLIKPEESQGFVSVQQIRQAKENVGAALQGQQPPYPPSPEDDHVAKLEVYTSIAGVLQQAGQVSDILNMLIQIQQQLLAAVQEKQGTPGQQVKLEKPVTDVLGVGR